MDSYVSIAEQAGADIHARELALSRSVAIYSIILNIVLAAGKIMAGHFAHSDSLFADGLHSGADIIASGSALFALSLAAHKSDSFPYGLYKLENIAALTTSIILLLAAYEIGKEALLGGHRMPDARIGLPVALVSAGLTIGFGLWQWRKAKALESPALKADATDHIVDSISTMVVALSMVAAMFGHAVDKYASMVVCLFIVYSGGELAMGAVRSLLDASVDPERMDTIRALVEDQPQVMRVIRLRGRMAGSRIMAELDVLLRTTDHAKADRIADQLEELVADNFPNVISLHVRTHFGHSDTLVRMTPLTGPGGGLSDHFGRAPWFLKEVVDKRTGQVEKSEELENPSAKDQTRHGFKTAKWILDNKADEVVVDKVTEGSGIFILREAGVTIKKHNSFNDQ